VIQEDSRILDPRIREDDGGMDPRIREDDGGMDPRIREDDGGMDPRVREDDEDAGSLVKPEMTMVRHPVLCLTNAHPQRHKCPARCAGILYNPCHNRICSGFRP